MAKKAQDIDVPEKQKFAFPEYSVIIEASSLQEAKDMLDEFISNNQA